VFRQGFSRLSSISLLYTLFAVVFSLLITVGAHPVAAAEGDLDTNFDSDGKVTTAIGGSNHRVRSVAIQSDGKIVAAGEGFGSLWDFALARYNTDGTLDTSFDSDGKVTTVFGASNDRVYSVAIQSDGKIVVAGVSYTGSSNDFALVRYNTDGSLDTSFDSDGKVTTDFGGGNDQAFSVAIQSDGKIVAAGNSRNGNWDFALARYNTDGSLDTSFDSGGKVTTDFGGGNDRAYSVAIQSDGKIVAAGYSSNGSNNDFALARYNTDGTLDTNFDSGGKVTTDFGGGNDYAFSVAIQSDGKIVAAGRGSNGGDDFALVRYNTDGTLDTNFDSGGKVTTDFGGDDDQAYSVAIQSDGKIVVAGLSYTGSNNGFALVRYNTDGTLDTSFDSDGKVTTAIGGTNDRAYSVAIQSDGKIVAAGYSFSGISQDFALVRYLGGGASAASVASSSVTPAPAPTPVPTLPLFGLGILVSLLGFFGLRKLRQ
jgi:uncharacterized delta-60 repeat protein